MKTRLDVIHSNMIQRCSNPNHPYYGRYGGRERDNERLLRPSLRKKEVIYV